MPTLPEDVRVLALLLPDAIEGAHQGHPDFRVGGRIFATLWPDEQRVVVRLTRRTQAERVAANPAVVEPVPGSWGARGWTSVELHAADEEMLRSVLLSAWRTVAPAALLTRYAALLID